MKTIELTKTERGRWRARFSDRPDAEGCGKRPEDAIAAIYIEMIGKLILENPEQFGLQLQWPAGNERQAAIVPDPADLAFYGRPTDPEAKANLLRRMNLSEDERDVD